MRLIGGRSGFKTARDLVLFITGLGICIYHILTTPPADLNVTLLLFGAGLAGLPTAFRQDEKKESK